MDAYKSPESNIEVVPEPVCKPVNAVVYGLLISIGLVLFVSIIEGIVFLAMLGPETISEGDLNLLLANSVPFLVTDSIMSAAIMYYAGTSVRKHAVGKEIKFGRIVSLVTFAFFLPIYISTDSLTTYPLWYNLFIFSAIFWAIQLGAKPKTS